MSQSRDTRYFSIPTAHTRTTMMDVFIANVRAGKWAPLLVLALFGGATAQTDNTPSVRAFGLLYNSGAYTAAQAGTMASRYDMVAFGADAYTTTYYVNMIDSLRTQKPGAVVLIYNSTDLNKVNNSTTTANEWDSLQAYAGGYPNRIFYHSLDQQALTLGANVLLPGVQNNSDSSLSENARFIGVDYRRHLNYGDPLTRQWQIRFNTSLLSNPVKGSSRYADGIWWDNCAPSQSLQQRSSESPSSVMVELDNKAWHYDQAWLPSKERPSEPISALRLRFEDHLLPMLKQQMDTFRTSPSWHPEGRRLSHATNWAEVRFDVEWSGYHWRSQMYDSNYTKYAYMEHTPNPLKAGLFLGPGASNSASTISTYYWSAKGPISYFAHDTLAMNQGVCVVYHPGFPYTGQYKPYGVANRLYSDLALYYVMRTDSTYWKIHAYNGQSNVGGGTGIAPGTSDSVMWVGAYAYDFSPSFPKDSIPFAYASSVPCTDCDSRMQHDGLGKDGAGQNWVVFRRNMPNGNIALHRSVPGNGTTTGSSTYTPDVPLGGQYRKVQIDGSLGPIVTSDRFRNGEGGIYVFSGSVGNTAPTTPVPTSPTGGILAPTSPTLTTYASTDAEDESLTYTFQVSKFQNFSSLATSGSVTSSSTTVVTWPVTPLLESGTSYWWRVKAADFLSSSSWSSAQSFQTDVAANSPPTVPSPTSPPNGSTVTQASPTLVIGASSDVDGNPLTYDFEFYTGGASPVSSTAGVSASGGSAQWAVPLTISDGTGCQWRARAFDGALYSGWTGLQSFTISLAGGNTPPTSPIHSSPAVGDTVVGQQFTFTWQNSFDPDGDQLGYDIWLMSDSSGGADLDSARNIFQANGSSSTSRTFSTQLTSGQQYWWRLRANDGQSWTPKTIPWSFIYYDFSVGTQVGQAEAVSPPDGSTVRATHPTLVSANISQAGNNFYFFEVAKDSSFISTVDVSAPVPEGAGDQTLWTTVVRLNAGEVYYWRVKANDNPFSLTSSFRVELSPHASPAPFRPAEHSFTTFHDIPEGGTLLLMTVNGETVRRWYNVFGGTVVWDGTNGSGQPVASDVYLWYVEGSELRGKLIVQR